MRWGYLMITLGFIAGSYSAVIAEDTVPWGAFLAAFSLGVLGVLVVRVGARGRTRTEEVLSANMSAAEENLHLLAREAAALDGEKGSIPVYELRHRIDRKMPGFIRDFVEARESIAHAYGLQAYADLMSQFAAGERYLYRAWCSSADGYRDEAWRSLALARTYLEEAWAMLERARVGDRS